MRACAVWGPKVRAGADGESHLRPSDTHSRWPSAVSPCAPPALPSGVPRDPTSLHSKWLCAGPAPPRLLSLCHKPDAARAVLTDRVRCPQSFAGADGSP